MQKNEKMTFIIISAINNIVLLGASIIISNYLIGKEIFFINYIIIAFMIGAVGNLTIYIVVAVLMRVFKRNKIVLSNGNKNEKSIYIYGVMSASMIYIAFITIQIGFVINDIIYNRKLTVSNLKISILGLLVGMIFYYIGNINDIKYKITIVIFSISLFGHFLLFQYEMGINLILLNLVVNRISMGILFWSITEKFFDNIIQYKRSLVISSQCIVQGINLMVAVVVWFLGFLCVSYIRPQRLENISLGLNIIATLIPICFIMLGINLELYINKLNIKKENNHG